MSSDLLKNLGSEKKKIFIVEDNEVYSKLLQSFLQNRFPDTEIKMFRIGEVCLMEMEMDRNPNVVIMDYFLNSKYEEAQNGLEIIKRIKEIKPQTKIIVLSAQENLEMIPEVIKNQDCSYVQKGDEAFDQVEQYISEILQKQSPMSFEFGLQ
jgi:DNA-binding NarL/FixJ family response regulator